MFTQYKFPQLSNLHFYLQNCFISISPHSSKHILVIHLILYEYSHLAEHYNIQVILGGGGGGGFQVQLGQKYLALMTSRS